MLPIENDCRARYQVLVRDKSRSGFRTGELWDGAMENQLLTDT